VRVKKKVPDVSCLWLKPDNLCASPKPLKVLPRKKVVCPRIERRQIRIDG
jgi:hypothetical protein